MSPHPLAFHDFTSAKIPLWDLARKASRQASYLLHYLGDLGAKSAVEEPIYFDRDYLSEFSAFYGASSRMLPNHCRRFLFFSGEPVTRHELTAALGESQAAKDALQARYLGFMVWRPLHWAPLGRTVLGWYPDQKPDTPRVTASSRDYVAHLAGIPLRVTGLAWQQQDANVGRCATVALWSMLQASALDGTSAPRTTAAVTSAAHMSASLGDRVFPSGGLTKYQVMAAMKEFGLAPDAISGDGPPVYSRHGGPFVSFTPRKLGPMLGLLARSGFSSILSGHLVLARRDMRPDEHALCLAGIRSSSEPVPPKGVLLFRDEFAEHVYLHDDNVGPAVRFRVKQCHEVRGVPYATLRAEPPRRLHGLPIPGGGSAGYPRLDVDGIITGLPDAISLRPERLMEHAFTYGKHLLRGHVGVPQVEPNGLTVGARFCRVAELLESHLGEKYRRLTVLLQVPMSGDALAHARLALQETVDPLSLYVGVVEVMMGNVPLVDIILDTTVGDRTPEAFCSIVYFPSYARVMRRVSSRQAPYGPMVIVQ